MRVLYAVFLLSIVVLVWAVLAVRRHIRNHDTQGGETLQLNQSKTDDSTQGLD
ncbi:hypothetical protein [Silvibacterium acidisoli]|uniref:hypothetical protein n=1 Tax=Acidobacteriaceae bacterium ZG23-2 TaxID=2883246 RepID=UPI00406C7A91